MLKEIRPVDIGTGSGSWHFSTQLKFGSPEFGILIFTLVWQQYPSAPHIALAPLISQSYASHEPSVKGGMHRPLHRLHSSDRTDVVTVTALQHPYIPTYTPSRFSEEQKRSQRVAEALQLISGFTCMIGTATQDEALDSPSAMLKLI